MPEMVPATLTTNISTSSVVVYPWLFCTQVREATNLYVILNLVVYLDSPGSAHPTIYRVASSLPSSHRLAPDQHPQGSSIQTTEYSIAGLYYHVYPYISSIPISTGSRNHSSGLALGWTI